MTNMLELAIILIAVKKTNHFSKRFIYNKS